MKVLILAGGYGTRLYAIIKNKPKAFLEIANKPLINYVLDKVKELKDVSEVLVVSNNKFYNDFVGWGRAYKDAPWPITIINDQTNTPEERLGSIGDIDFTLKKQNITEDLLVVGSDNLFDAPLTEYMKFSYTKKDKVTIGVYDIKHLEQANQYGIVEIDKESKIVSFEEKPANPKSTLISMCLYFLPKKTLGLIHQYLVESNKSDKAGEYIKWLAEETDVYAYKFPGKWYDIGSVESYQDAQNNFK